MRPEHYYFNGLPSVDACLYRQRIKQKGTTMRSVCLNGERGHRCTVPARRKKQDCAWIASTRVKLTFVDSIPPSTLLCFESLRYIYRIHKGRGRRKHTLFVHNYTAPRSTPSDLRRRGSSRRPLPRAGGHLVLDQQHHAGGGNQAPHPEPQVAVLPRHLRDGRLVLRSRPEVHSELFKGIGLFSGLE